MESSSTAFRRGSRDRAVRAGLSLSALLLSATAIAASAAAPSSGAEGGRLDQVHVRESKTGRRSLQSGVVVENGLANVRLTRDGKESRVDALAVERIVWGEVSPAFREGELLFERGDFEGAAAKFKLATDTEERAVVKAAARLRAAEALMEQGARDPSRLVDAQAELERFLADHANSRDVPEARQHQARVAWLAGDAARAGALFRSIFEAGAGATPAQGYPPLLCARAGLSAGEALLAAGDSLGAREVLGALKSMLGALKTQVPADSPEASAITAILAEAELGEGFALLANGQVRQAESFFQARLQNPTAVDARTRFGAMLGMAETHMADRNYSAARVLFARVAAIDFTDRDRGARATLRLAQATIELKEPDSPARARKWLDEVAGKFGDTPAAFTARQLLAKL